MATVLAPVTPALDALLDDARIFRAGKPLRRLPVDDANASTGIAALDAHLPWGGFARGNLTEILIEHDGIGELRLLLPALCAIARRQPLAWVTTPYLPYAPALAAAGLPLEQLWWVRAPRERALWAAEQCLRAGCLGAVLVWADSGDDRALRRLQMAAETGAAYAFLLRPARHAGNASPAALRLHLRARAGHSEVQVLKCRGAVVPAAAFDLPRPH
jgi:cell division inhibitor SulA